MADPQDLPRLDAYSVNDIFMPGEIEGPVVITAEAPVVGELMVDARGAMFLSPKPDDRGGPQMAVPVIEASEPAAGLLLGEIVAVAGRYDPETGLHIEQIARNGEPLRSASA